MRTPAAFLLLAAGLVAAGTPRNQSEHSSPTTTLTYTDREVQCLVDKMVLYSDGRCYTLHQQGPCLEGEWIVLDEPRDIGSNKPRVVCKRDPCPSYAKPFYWPEDGQCHGWSDKKTLCPRKGNELKIDSYGEGECVCEKTFARFEPELRNTSAEWEGDCYPLYRRSPCPVGRVLVPALLKGFGLVGRCDVDVCHRQNAAEPGASYVLDRRHNTCYKLGATGEPPCWENAHFDVDPDDNEVGCIDPDQLPIAHSVFSGWEKCGGNIKRLTEECREVVRLAQTFGREVSRRKPARRSSRFEK